VRTPRHPADLFPPLLPLSLSSLPTGQFRSALAPIDADHEAPGSRIEVWHDEHPDANGSKGILSKVFLFISSWHYLGTAGSLLHNVPQPLMPILVYFRSLELSPSSHCTSPHSTRHHCRHCLLSTPTPQALRTASAGPAPASVAINFHDSDPHFILYPSAYPPCSTMWPTASASRPQAWAHPFLSPGLPLRR